MKREDMKDGWLDDKTQWTGKNWLNIELKKEADKEHKSTILKYLPPLCDSDSSELQRITDYDYHYNDDNNDDKIIVMSINKIPINKVPSNSLITKHVRTASLNILPYKTIGIVSK